MKSPDFRRVLTLLIVADITVTVIGSLIGFESLGTSSLPPALQDYQHATATAEPSASTWFVGLTTLGLQPLQVVAWIALLRRWRSARWLYTTVVGVGLLILPFIGVALHPGWVSILEDISNILNGLILGLLYFSDLRTQWDRS